jgi:hypothetical protein
MLLMVLAGISGRISCKKRQVSVTGLGAGLSRYHDSYLAPDGNALPHDGQICSESRIYMTPFEMVSFPDLPENVYDSGSAAIYLDISSLGAFGNEVGRVLRNVLR